MRRLEDRINGTVHLSDAISTTVRADLDLVPGVVVPLAGGALPDGRPITLDVTVHR